MSVFRPISFSKSVLYDGYPSLSHNHTDILDGIVRDAVIQCLDVNVWGQSLHHGCSGACINPALAVFRAMTP